MELTTKCFEPHLPIFSGTLCGEMTDRERLGLPDYFKEFQLNITASYFKKKNTTSTVDDLMKKLQSSEVSLAEKIACGDLLAILGDPRIDTLNPTMVKIASSKVRIGLNESQIESVLTKFCNLGLDRKWIEKECPQHEVELSAFSIAKFPVTNSEYRDFLLDTQHPEIPSSWHFRQYPHDLANHPVYTITANSAEAYACWLSAKTGRKFRLPLEAEWEWAARGPRGDEFPWGNDFDPMASNTAECGLLRSTAVGVFTRGNSFFGLSDMAGNVEEYVADDYAPYQGGVMIKDHLVEIHGTYRIARGGSFARFRDLARTRRRHGFNPRSATYAMGFRLAESI